MILGDREAVADRQGQAVVEGEREAAVGGDRPAVVLGVRDAVAGGGGLAVPVGIREAAAEMESQVNRLYRGRRAYDLEEGTKLDLNKAIEQLNYMARTLREVQSEQSRVVYLQAAE